MNYKNQCRKCLLKLVLRRSCLDRFHCTYYFRFSLIYSCLLSLSVNFQLYHWLIDLCCNTNFSSVSAILWRSAITWLSYILGEGSPKSLTKWWVKWNTQPWLGAKNTWVVIGAASTSVALGLRSAVNVLRHSSIYGWIFTTFQISEITNLKPQPKTLMSNLFIWE